MLCLSDAFIVQDRGACSPTGYEISDSRVVYYVRYTNIEIVNAFSHWWFLILPLVKGKKYVFIGKATKTLFTRGMLERFQSTKVKQTQLFTVILTIEYVSRKCSWISASPAVNPTFWKESLFEIVMDFKSGYFLDRSGRMISGLTCAWNSELMRTESFLWVHGGNELFWSMLHFQISCR